METTQVITRLLYRGFNICLSRLNNSKLQGKFWIELNGTKLLCRDGFLYDSTYGNTDDVLFGWYDSVEEAKEMIDKYWDPDDTSFELVGAL